MVHIDYKSVKRQQIRSLESQETPSLIISYPRLGQQLVVVFARAQPRQAAGTPALLLAVAVVSPIPAPAGPTSASPATSSATAAAAAASTSAAHGSVAAATALLPLALLVV